MTAISPIRASFTNTWTQERSFVFVFFCF